MKFNTKLIRRLVCSFAMCLGLFTIQVSQAQDTAKIATAPQVKFVTNMGEFVAEVYLDKAPKTAENFLQYVRDKHYDGTIFTA